MADSDKDPCRPRGEQQISSLIIYLPSGLEVRIERFAPHNSEGPVADDTVPMFVKFGSAILDGRDPLKRGRDAIC